MGFEKVSVGDVTVDRQKMALVDQAYWAGDGETSGKDEYEPREEIWIWLIHRRDLWLRSLIYHERLRWKQPR